jgi:hypothetical protein
MRVVGSTRDQRSKYGLAGVPKANPALSAVELAFAAALAPFRPVATIEPSSVVTKSGAGELAPDEWREYCGRLGIPSLRLAPPVKPAFGGRPGAGAASRRFGPASKVFERKVEALKTLATQPC